MRLLQRDGLGVDEQLPPSLCFVNGSNEIFSDCTNISGRVVSVVHFVKAIQELNNHCRANGGCFELKKERRVGLWSEYTFKCNGCGESERVTTSSLSTILSAKDSIHEAAESGTSSKKKRLKKSTYADVDKAVFTWFLDTRARNVPISGAILQQKAKHFASILGCDDFKASNGWLQGFKSRHGVVGRVTSGESASADSDASASCGGQPSWKRSLRLAEAARNFCEDGITSFVTVVIDGSWSHRSHRP
ncbi:hypothetical protein HPB50_014814 [Hyalomma asiaticum]|uniref:Uncharacterized protein n=1 Tax=Hyalomma asiaticum TaxID=266040 RepID=A0ACB7SEQ7_HYAAI|nr:hypothetical protein HPB50_014814 [Hyalomma asiaticum]